MPRNVTSDFILALDEPYLWPAIFIDIGFASGPIHVWTGYQPQFLNGLVYTGVGSLLEISTIEDGSTVQARCITLTFSGLDPLLIPTVLSEYQVGQPVTITLALLAGPGLLAIDFPIVAWSGFTDQPTITVNEKTATVTIACESLLVDMNVPVPYRYTNQDQQLFYPGDRGFGWVNAIQSIAIYWNQLPNSDGNP